METDQYVSYIDSVIPLTTGHWVFDYLVKFLIALALGGLIGGERSLRQKVAGMRTHIVITAASCMIASCGQMIAIHMAGGLDPTRLAGQILTGVGFVGAGAIMRRGNMAQGVTTAATIFFCSGIGITCGLGLCSIAIMSVLMTCLAVLFGQIFLPSDEQPVKTIRVVCDNNQYGRILAEHDSCSISSVRKTGESVEVLFDLPRANWGQVDGFIRDLTNNPRVTVVECVSE